MKRTFRILTAWICAVTLILAAAPGFVAAAEEAPVVKNYAQLLTAVNEQHATRVLISKKYKQGGNEGSNIIPRAGETITIASETGEPMKVNGRFDIMGEGTIVFENIAIEAHAGHPALWIGDGADVTVDSVTAGKAKGDHGLPGAIVSDSRLTVQSAAGSDGKGGVGGDGIYAYGSSTVEVGTATGGNAPKGIGGSGVVAFAGAKVEVTQEARGGNGLYAAGKGALIGWNAEVNGNAADGELLEGQKKLDPEKITNRMLLELALRSGATEIHIDEQFKAGNDLNQEQKMFTNAETIRLIGGAEGKNTVMDCQVNVHAGNWSIEGIDLITNAKGGESPLSVTGTARVTMNGDITAKGKNERCIFLIGKGILRLTGNLFGSVYADDDGTAEITGRAEISGRNQAGYAVEGNAVIRQTGNIVINNDSNAIVNRGGTIEITGDITGQKNRRYPLVFSDGGKTHITGTLTMNGKAETIYNRNGGDILVEGDVISNAPKLAAITLKPGAGSVTVRGNVTARTTAAKAEGNTLTVEGNLTVQSKKQAELFTTTGSGQVVVTGEAKWEEHK